MLRPRVIPVLLVRGGSLVKTVRFGRFTYIGDPCNTVRIFNELEVDELAVLDIGATREGRGPDLELLADLAGEAFMPLAYGGGIRSAGQASAVLRLGFEKVVLNTHALADPTLLTQVARLYGDQAVVAAIDVRKNQVWCHSARRSTRRDPVAWAREAESRRAGEILLTSVEREGTWQGYDLPLVRRVAEAVGVPVVANGGAASLADIGAVVREAGASAAAVGSLVVFQKKGKGVLVNFPSPGALQAVLAPPAPPAAAPPWEAGA